MRAVGQLILHDERASEVSSFHDVDRLLGRSREAHLWLAQHRGRIWGYSVVQAIEHLMVIEVAAVVALFSLIVHACWRNASGFDSTSRRRASALRSLLAHGFGILSFSRLGSRQFGPSRCSPRSTIPLLISSKPSCVRSFSSGTLEGRGAFGTRLQSNLSEMRIVLDRSMRAPEGCPRSEVECAGKVQVGGRKSHDEACAHHKGNSARE